MIKTWTKWMEKRIVASDFLIEFYEKYYDQIVKDELELAEVKDGDKILVIGGGSIPCTALKIAKNTRASVHVIDIDEVAVSSAREIVNRMGLEDQILVTRANGQDVDVTKYDLIHVALQVSPKEEVVENIWNQSLKGTKILVRLPKKALKVFYSNISDGFLERKKDCIKNCSLNNKLNTMDDVLLLVKN